VKTRTRVNVHYIESTDIEKHGTHALSGMDAILVPGGFGERGIEGKIAAVRFARENRIPYLGICLGMQLACIEFGRHALGLENANSTEFNRASAHPVIALITEWQDAAKGEQKRDDATGKGGTMRLGAQDVFIGANTLARSIYGDETVRERHRHRYEFNTKYRSRIEEAGMVLSGTSPDGTLVEMIEIPDHPWFLASQFHPEFKSKPLDCHPMFKGFVRASLAHRRERTETPTLKGLRVVAASERTT